MNHNYYVPDFELTPNPSPSTRPPPPNKSAASAPTTEEEEDMMELLWQDGHVVFQSQNQRSQRKPNIIINGVDDAINIMPPKQIPQAENLFMQEDEMANWLHYPLDDTPPPPPLPPFDHHHHPDFLYPPPNSSSLPISNFTHFSRYRGINTTHEQGGPSVSISNQPPTPTVVDSSDTPAAKPPQSRISHTIAPLGISSSDLGTCDFTVSSSPSDSASVEPTTPKPSPPPAIEDRKRKGRATADDDADCQQINQSIDVNNYSDVKKRARGSTSTKKSRAAEVHNLSERKRRDRINEKMKALQELIPRCNKSDKASMLDEAIEYLKSLQLQVQMMSMGCTMVPMMFPGIQHYMPTVGMGMGMGIGPGMGMNRPMMQFPHVHPGPSVQGQSSTSHMAPRFPASAFPLPPPGAAIPDSNRIQATNLPDSVMNSAANHNLSHPQMQNVVVDPYQQYYLNTNQSRMPMFTQDPTVMQPDTSQPGGSGSSSNHRNLQSG